MARSTRKTPVFGYCCGTDTVARRAGNKRIRLACKRALRNCDDYDELTIPTPEEIGEVDWHWPSDGRHYWADAPAKFMRK